MEALQALEPTRLHVAKGSFKSAASDRCRKSLITASRAPRVGRRCCSCTRGVKQSVSSRVSSWFGTGVEHAASLKSSRRRELSTTVCEDTRIHWDSEDEGWVGGRSLEKGEEGEGNTPINSTLIPLLLDKNDTHYKFLGLLPSADIEAVRVAFRKLAPVYHPDTSNLPKEVAAEKFVRLREAYEVLSDETKRRLYDWQLALQSKPKDVDFVWPYEADRGQWGPNGPGQRPTTIRPGDFDRDWYDGKNRDLSPQSQSALVFDLFAFFVAIATALYFVVFKNPTPP